jgi:hypothetical protein
MNELAAQDLCMDEIEPQLLQFLLAQNPPFRRAGPEQEAHCFIAWF